MLNVAFEPGSTMNPFIIAGALDNGVVTPETVFDCENGIGAKIALGLGKDRLHQTLRSFGFGEMTGVPLEGEVIGNLGDPEAWDDSRLARIANGESLACTPLQLVRAYCALANGGQLVQLRLIGNFADSESGLKV